MGVPGWVTKVRGGLGQLITVDRRIRAVTDEEVVPDLVELEVAVPRSMPTAW
jgi:hypothetical protein